MSELPAQAYNRVILRDLISKHFNISELADLCFALHIDFEEFSGRNKPAFVRDLVLWAERHGYESVRKLIAYCRKNRPDSSIPWPNPPVADLPAGGERAEEERQVGKEPERHEHQESEGQELQDRVGQARQEGGAAFGDTIRSERIRAFKRLWSTLEPLAKYAPPGPFDYAAATTLANELRRWYFEDGGGMFLSEDGRAAYFPLQGYLAEHILSEETFRANPRSLLPFEHVNRLRLHSSLLRAALADDIGVGRRTYDATDRRIDDPPGRQTDS